MFDQIVKGAIFGYVVGDALGLPIEFTPRTKLENRPVNHMLAFGTHNMPLGTWSDDSSMMLCTLFSLIEKHKIELDDIMMRFSMWAKEGYMTPYGKAFGVGRTTLKAIGKFWSGKEIAFCGCFSDSDNGNGSLMRILPISLFNAFSNIEIDKKIENIHNCSSLTHSHERSCVACGIYNFVLENIIKNKNKSAIFLGLDQAKKYYKDSSEYHTFERLFAHDFYCMEDSEIKSSGYVVDTLEAAIWSLLNCDSYRETVLRAVNLGGDTDTIAAICGSLAGALYGYADIPEEWIEKIIHNDKIFMLCNDFENLIKSNINQHSIHP